MHTALLGTVLVGALAVPAAPLRADENAAPHPPALLAPSEGATLHRAGNTPFSISAVDPNADPYTGAIVIADAAGAEVARFATTPARSGGVAIGVLVTPLPAGSYTWTAEATDVHGATSDPSTARSFTVTPPPTTGGGAVAGVVEFAPPGIPPTMGVCEASSSTFELESAAAVFNTAVIGYVGSLTVRGSGTTDCESMRFGTGTLSVDVDGTGLTESTLSCRLTGSYTRVEVAMALTLAGDCTLNRHPVSRVVLAASLLFVPQAVDAGATTRVTRAVVGGDFVVVPE